MAERSFSDPVRVETIQQDTGLQTRKITQETVFKLWGIAGVLAFFVGILLGIAIGLEIQ